MISLIYAKFAMQLISEQQPMLDIVVQPLSAIKHIDKKHKQTKKAGPNRVSISMCVNLLL